MNPEHRRDLGPISRPRGPLGALFGARSSAPRGLLARTGRRSTTRGRVHAQWVRRRARACASTRPEDRVRTNRGPARRIRVRPPPSSARRSSPCTSPTDTPPLRWAPASRGAGADSAAEGVSRRAHRRAPSRHGGAQRPSRHRTNALVQSNGTCVRDGARACGARRARGRRPGRTHRWRHRFVGPAEPRTASRRQASATARRSSRGAARVERRAPASAGPRARATRGRLRGGGGARVGQSWCGRAVVVAPSSAARPSRRGRPVAGHRRSPRAVCISEVESCPPCSVRAEDERRDQSSASGGVDRSRAGANV